MTVITPSTRLLRFNRHANSGTASPPPPLPAFDPISLPFSIVFEARTGRRLDSGGSPASLPGDPVGVWQSRASGGLEAVQSGFSARPTFQTVGGKPVLRFTADDFVSVPLGADAPGFGDVITVVVRVEAAPTGGYQVIAAVGSPSTNGAWILVLDTMGRVALGSFGLGFCISTPAPLGTGPHTIVARKNGAFMSLRVDGVEVGAASASATFTSRRGPLTIGTAQDYSLFLNGDLYFLAAAPQTCLTDAACVQMEAYCAAL